MKRALDYELFREVDAPVTLKVKSEPESVAIVLNEELLNETNGLLDHCRIVFLIDRMHDWEYRDGNLRCYSPMAEDCTILVAYKIEEV